MALRRYLLGLCLGGLAACSSGAEAPPEGRGEGGPIAVTVAPVSTGVLTEPVEYVGTVAPQRTVSLRAQAEGRLLGLTGEVGDRLNQGQLVARLDDSLFNTATSQARAQLDTLTAELAQGRIQVEQSKIALAQARIELTQAQNDARRYRELAGSGAVADRDAETFQTAAQIAAQGVAAAEQQVNLAQAAVNATLSRMAAQQANVSETEQQRAFTQVISPLNSVVMARLKEPGDLVRDGEEILQLGDFAQVKVVVPVSELDLGGITPGQLATVQLDAFPDQVRRGTVRRIAPAAESEARQVPVEILLDNPDGQLRGGMLARVTFLAATPERFLIPESALQGDEAQPQVFVLRGEDRVEAKTVFVGDRRDGEVEVLSGLTPSDRIIINSAQPLQSGATVRLSILSQ